MSTLLNDETYEIEVNGTEVKASSTIDDFETTITISKEIDEKAIENNRNERARDIYMEIVNRHRMYMS